MVKKQKIWEVEMKRTWLLFVCFIIFNFNVFCIANEDQVTGGIDLLAKLFEGKEFPVTERIVRLYHDKKIEEVFEIGEERLEDNPEDILGLVIQFEEALMEYDPDAMSQAATMLHRKLSGIEKESFQEKYRGFKEEVLDELANEAKKMTPEEREKIEESLKRLVEGPDFIIPVLMPLLMIIEEEGLFVDVEIDDDEDSDGEDENADDQNNKDDDNHKK